MAIEVVRQKTLVASVKHYVNILQTHFLGLVRIPLNQIEEDGAEIEQWYTLQRF